MNRKVVLITSVVLFLLTSIGMAFIDTFMQNEITPYGIISFEFIKSIEASNSAMQAWGDIGKTATGISLGIDFFYIALYIIIVCIALNMTAEKVLIINPSFSKLLLFTAYVFPVVGLLDVAENYSLIQLLLESQNSAWPITAYYCAAAKFGGLAIVLMLIGCGQVYAKIKAR